MGVDPPSGVRCRSRYWKRGFSRSIKEITRCRQRGQSSGCPGLYLFPHCKAFWVAARTCAKHKPRWGRDWAAGRLLSRQPAFRASHPRELGLKTGSAIISPASDSSESYRLARLSLIWLQSSRGTPIEASCCVSKDKGRTCLEYLDTSGGWSRGREYLHDQIVVSASEACAFRVKWTRESACCSLQPRLSPFDLWRAKAFCLCLLCGLDRSWPGTPLVRPSSPP